VLRRRDGKTQQFYGITHGMLLLPGA